MRWSDLRDVSKEDMLAVLGLEPKRGFFEMALPGLGLFGAGLLVGAGLGMMFATPAGRDFSRTVFQRASEKMTTGRGAELETQGA